MPIRIFSSALICALFLMQEEIIAAGYGGQGLVFLGHVLAHLGMILGKNVTSFPSYGAEMRGGTANCAVIISDTEIASPVVEKPISLIAMNQQSLDKFEPLVQPQGFILVNSSLARSNSTRKDIRYYLIPASELADKLGNIRTANMVALGAFLKMMNLASVAQAEQALKAVLPTKRAHLVEINLKAIQVGFDYQLNR
ncbi:MAG: 2-oxoacid:acceptor oxidoreductase family protein [bacterium]|nr:2-oxoacid:acceptor oxidoreductase family protein [bacterium]